MLRFLLLISILHTCFGARLPYLGGDLSQYLKQPKRDTLSSQLHLSKPATPQQKEDAQRFSSKFSEIAKAYTEGYKAAIKAVQARALIAQKRIVQNKLDTRSVIPGAPVESMKMTERSNVATFQAPVPNQLTENGIEKSGIPRPDIKEIKDSSIPTINEVNNAKINDHNSQDNKKAAMLDGFDTVAKEAALPEDKRNTNERKKRSHMPYLGQNLDALGIIRAKPNWESPKKKSISPNLPSPPAQVQRQAANQPYPAQMPEPENPYLDRFSDRRTYGARPNPFVNPFAQRVQEAQEMRQNIPYNPYYMQPAYPNPYFAGIMSPAALSTETKKNNIESATALPGVERKKKSASPEPDVASLNYAARHRNVYLDGVSGDPISGGSSVLSRQNVYYKSRHQ